MRIAEKLRWGLGAVTLAVLALGAGTAGDALSTARELANSNKWDEVVTTVEEHLRENAPSPQLDDLYGTALFQLGRKDEAAHYLERAYTTWPEGDKEAAKVRKRLMDADPLFGRRESLMKKAAKDLLDSAKALEASGQKVRAMELLQRVQPLARGPDLAGIKELIGKIRSSTTAVDLTATAGKRPAEGWPEITVESKRYVMRAHLEPSVAELLGHTMDEIFEYYVKIYFDGNTAYLDPRKATIVIHPDQADLRKGWTQDDGAPEGWWSPMDWEVHAYDTRPNTGRLDWMLETLFHEASHQFMTMLARGGLTPAWLNEGTSSFFEGASAMADGTVLWPDAARERLRSLYSMLTIKSDGGGRIPSFLDVISFYKPGSYPGEYYPWGWGLVYYLQQYEDPATLEYPYRALYMKYRDEVVRKGGEPKAAFERVLVGAGTPRGNQTLEDFERDWRKWIVETIYPLHFGSSRRELRMAEVERYVKAAKAAAAEVAAKKTPKVPEAELLLRALGHLDYVRTKIDDTKKPKPEILLLQAELFEKVGQGGAAATILEDLVEVAESGDWTDGASQVEALNKRIAKLDKKNAALIGARQRSRNLARSADKLVTDYLAEPLNYRLRAYTLASLAATAFDDATGLGEKANELKDVARESGTLKGAATALTGPKESWKTIFTNLETKFEVSAEKLELGAVRPVGRICVAVPLKGEYEVRAKLTRVGPIETGAQHGLVVAGTPDGSWAVVAIDHEGKLTLKRLVYDGSSVNETTVLSVKLATPPPPDVPFEMGARVTDDGSIDVTIAGDGPYPFRMPIERASTSFAGVYVKNGSITMEAAVVEQAP